MISRLEIIEFMNTTLLEERRWDRFVEKVADRWIEDQTEAFGEGQGAEAEYRDSD